MAAAILAEWKTQWYNHDKIAKATEEAAAEAAEAERANKTVQAARAAYLEAAEEATAKAAEAATMATAAKIMEEIMKLPKCLRALNTVNEAAARATNEAKNVEKNPGDLSYLMLAYTANRLKTMAEYALDTAVLAEMRAMLETYQVYDLTREVEARMVVLAQLIAAHPLY